MRSVSASAWFWVVLAVGCRPPIPDRTFGCATSAECPPSYTCEDGRCTAPGSDGGVTLPLGESCSTGADCSSGNCVDGYCCDSACDEQCEACDVPGELGFCTPIAGNPHGDRGACASDGTECGGACDGSSTRCTFAPATTICGAACDGNCDGAGSCSSVAGGTCPGGFACGTSGCLTSCTGDADCQRNFTCDTGAGSCNRVPELDCLDGLDDNGDELVDCADPTCLNSRVVCVPPPGGAPLGILSSSCPVGYTPTHINQGFNVPNTCSGCGCTTSASCSFTLMGDRSGAGCFNPTWAMGTVSATARCVDVPDLDYYSIQATGNPSATCNNVQSGVPNPASYSSSTNFCESPRSAATSGCSGSDVCVAVPPAAEPICALSSGACAAGYVDAGTYYRDGITDTRTCSCSGCSITSNGSCDPAGLRYVAHTSSNNFDPCIVDNPAPYLYCTGGCCPWNGPTYPNPPDYWDRFRSITHVYASTVPGNSGAACAAGAGSVSGGTATPGATLRLCCPDVP